MSIPLFACSRFLVRLPIQEDESLRGYVIRVAQRNASFDLVQPVLASLSTVTAAIPELSRLTGNSADVLSAHGCIVSDQNHQPCGVRFGNVTLPAGQVWLHRRKVCPLCLLNDGISRSCWELRRYSVCHHHGIELVGECSDCSRVFTWGTSTPSTCACGLNLTEMKANPAASSNQKKLSKLIAESARKTIQCGVASPIESAPQAMIPVDWTLILIEFIKNVLIQGFWNEVRDDTLNLKNSDREDLTVAMLGDGPYRDCLREALFMHAAKDPMSLVRALTPGNRPQVIRQLLGGCIDEVPFHESLWKLHRSTPVKQKISRKLQPEKKPRELQPKQAGFWRMVSTERRTPNGKLLPRQRASDPGGITWRPKEIRQFVGFGEGTA